MIEFRDAGDVWVSNLLVEHQAGRLLLYVYDAEQGDEPTHVIPLTTTQALQESDCAEKETTQAQEGSGNGPRVKEALDRLHAKFGTEDGETQAAQAQEGEATSTYARHWREARERNFATSDDEAGPEATAGDDV